MTRRFSQLPGAGLAAAAALTATMLLGAPASAAIITYTLDGQLDGRIGGTTLVATPFTWTVTANTLAPTTVNGAPALQALTASLDLAGLGSASFLDPTYVFQSSYLFGFTDATGANGPGWGNESGVTLEAAQGAHEVGLTQATGGFDTSLGALSLSDFTNLTFSATVAPTPPLLYVLSGTLTGTLGGQSFTDDPFTWSVTADTSATDRALGPALRTTGNLLRLGGFSDFTVPGDFDVVLDQASGMGALAWRDLRQNLGFGGLPVGQFGPGDAFTDIPVNFGASPPVETPYGQLSIVGGDNVRFSAIPVTAIPVAGAPEPSAWALMALGFGGLGGVLRRKRAKALA